MNPEWFAGRLKELRIAAGLTQAELAKRAGVSQAGIAHLEARRREPAWSMVLALAQALGVTCDAFLRPPAETSPPPADAARAKPARRKKGKGKK